MMKGEINPPSLDPIMFMPRTEWRDLVGKSSAV